jgi:clan AA aspartic protease
MGKTVNRIRVTNNTDLANARSGLIAADAVRTVELDALVDTGATELAIPLEAVRSLGLQFEGHREARLADGRTVMLPRVTGVRLEILGRDMTCDALVLPEAATPLLGQIALEGLDLIVDPKRRQVRVNPRSPDVPMVELLSVHLPQASAQAVQTRTAVNRSQRRGGPAARPPHRPRSCPGE